MSRVADQSVCSAASFCWPFSSTTPAIVAPSTMTAEGVALGQLWGRERLSGWLRRSWHQLCSRALILRAVADHLPGRSSSILLSRTYSPTSTRPLAGGELILVVFAVPEVVSRMAYLQVLQHHSVQLSGRQPFGALVPPTRE